MSFIKINGIQLFVDIQGEGYPIILIHGVGGDHQVNLGPTIPHLSKRFKTIALDCRGHGQSDKPLNYTIDDHVNDILGIMDHFGLEKTHILGISMGSYIAQQVAFTYPERINKLILTVPKSNGLSSSTARLFQEHASEIHGLDMHESIVRLLKYMVFDPELMINHLEVFETKLTAEQFRTANKALMNFDFRKDLPKIKAETLVVSGKYDSLNPPEEGQEVASLIENSTFVEMQYSGHAPNWEEPQRYLNIVESFLAD